MRIPDLSEACAAELASLCWPDGFRCPQCGHDHGWYCSTRRHYECARCSHQTSLTAGTLFYGSHVPLTKWFWALYWVGTDTGGISALRLSQLIDVQWRTADSM